MKILPFAIGVLSLMMVGTSAFAQTTTFPIVPPFPSCLNPAGAITVHYDTGIHGIVGDSSTHTGSDSVYQIDEQKTLQCFCATDGSGIQTDWVKTSSFTQNVIDALVADGWTFVPNGLAWGLTDSPYYAKNSQYICSTDFFGKGGGGNGGNGGGGSEDTGRVAGAVTKTPHRSVMHHPAVAGAVIPILPPTGSMDISVGIVAISVLVLLIASLVWKIAKRTI